MLHCCDSSNEGTLDFRTSQYIPLYNNHFHRNKWSFATPLNKSSLHISRPLSSGGLNKISTAECHGISAIQLPLAKRCQIPDFNSMSWSKSHKKVRYGLVFEITFQRSNADHATQPPSPSYTMAVKQMVFEGSDLGFSSVTWHWTKDEELLVWKIKYVYSMYPGKLYPGTPPGSMKNPATLPMGDKLPVTTQIWNANTYLYIYW